MLTNATFLKGLVIHATDGELGTVDEFYFDDETWVIRYLTVETGGWLTGRQVLISPISVIHADWQAKRLDVALTKKQVENSPNIDTHQPVSRRLEAEYCGYYGYPYYWDEMCIRDRFWSNLRTIPARRTCARSWIHRLRRRSGTGRLGFITPMWLSLIHIWSRNGGIVIGNTFSR